MRNRLEEIIYNRWSVFALRLALGGIRFEGVTDIETLRDSIEQALRLIEWQKAGEE